MTESISIGFLSLPISGMLLAFGIAMGALLSAFESKRRNYDPEIIYYLFLPLTIWGLIGARLWHILTPPLSSVQLGLTPQYYLSHPLDVIAVWIGGLGIPGAWIGGGIGLLIFAHKNEMRFGELADILAPGLALAQAIGRVGNYFNQELYGLPANIPWKIFIEPAYRLTGYESVEYYHPLFAYESILSFANLILLLWLSRHLAEMLWRGDLFLAYLGIYSLVRFLLEFLRLDVALAGGLNINQVFFAAVFLFAGVGFYWRHRIISGVQSL